jgi:hypothetical protein
MDSPSLKATRNSSIIGVFCVIYMRTPKRYASINPLLFNLLLVNVLIPF